MQLTKVQAVELGSPYHQRPREWCAPRLRVHNGCQCHTELSTSLNHSGFKISKLENSSENNVFMMIFPKKKSSINDNYFKKWFIDFIAHFQYLKLGFVPTKSWVSPRASSAFEAIQQRRRSFEPRLANIEVGIEYKRYT